LLYVGEGRENEGGEMTELLWLMAFVVAGYFLAFVLYGVGL
jgi:hypothetical protein